jgi:hypothetical protein
LIFLAKVFKKSFFQLLSYQKIPKIQFQWLQSI